MTTKHNISMNNLLANGLNVESNNIHIHQDLAITDANDITMLKNILSECKTRNISITLHTQTTENIECMLEYISSIYIYINTSEDFAKFLDFDNHLAINDTKNKSIWLYVNGNNDVSIDGVKPNDLPLSYQIITYLPSKNIE